MEQSIHLIIHNVTSVLSAVILTGLAFFTYLNGQKKTLSVVLSMTLASIAIFIISHVIGVNIADPNTSRIVLMFNLSLFFIGAFNLHLIFLVLGTAKKHSFIITFVYISTVIFTVLFAISPNLFLTPSTPKMYFVNYYEPGALNWVRIVFLFLIILPYIIYLIYSAYKKLPPSIQKKQYKYLIMTILVGYMIGFIPNFLVYGISFDPLWGMMFGALLAIPLIYGAVQYELFNVKVIAKEAFFYSMAVGLVGGLIIFLNYANRFLEQTFPTFPDWIMPLISAVLAVTIVFVIWRRLRQGDLLKYEFVNIITHKFRTPLTYIKWSSENLLKTDLSKQTEIEIRKILNANAKLVELTNILTNIPQDADSTYDYHFSKHDLSKIVGDIVESLIQTASAKHIEITSRLEPDLTVIFDDERIKFIIHSLIENAISYTPENQKIEVATYRAKKEIICLVKDSGIGISKEELPMIFYKFYRSSEAKKTDTEGMGLALYLSREIMKRHNGKIWVVSEGLNKGSTFYISLPLKN